MKKILTIIITFIILLGLTSCEQDEPTPDPNKPKNENKYMLQEEEASFNFFWETQNINELLGGCGLIPDRYPSNGLASIASVGFGLAAFVVGVENNWITKQEAYDRSLLTLNGMDKLEKVNGFYYHFYQEKLGTPAKGSEISNIDTAIFICGALLAGKYFGGEVETLANKIYDEVNWNWFVNKNTNNFYMAYDANSKSFSGAWGNYGEQLMMYFLGAGSKTYPIEKIVYDSFRRNTGSYKGVSCINSWFGSIFTYQFSHAFIDFRNIIDENNINWFDNSVNASICNYNYCIDMSSKFRTFSKTSWGLTACDTPTGYSGLLGAFPSGNNGATFKNDGTVAPAGAIGSLVFVPDKVLPCFKYYSTLLDGDLVGDYGYKDAFNFEGSSPWIATDVIGIDKGITVMMIENYRSELIWKYFMELDCMKTAIQKLGFREV